VLTFCLLFACVLLTFCLCFACRLLTVCLRLASALLAQSENRKKRKKQRKEILPLVDKKNLSCRR
jgi:hypothetical protein